MNDTGAMATSIRRISGAYVRAPALAVAIATPHATPPDYVRDLFTDIRDGIKLLRLLEVLAGVRLPIERASVMQRAHYLSNVKTGLDFLTEERKVKLVNINATDVVDGRPAIVLGLIWSIILSFQIDEHDDVLQDATRIVEKSIKKRPVQLNGSAETPTQKINIPETQATRRKALIAWTGRRISSTLERLGLHQVKDFGVGWRDGRAFCALVHSIDPSCVDLAKIGSSDNKTNLEIAFSAAEKCLGIPRLLDVEDVDVENPDERSIMTYISQFLKEYPTGKKTTSQCHGKGGEAVVKSVDTSLDAVDSAIDPSLVLSASTVSLHNPKPVRREEHMTAHTLLDDEGIRSLLAATSTSLSGSDEDEIEANPEAAQSMPVIRGSPSPRRQARARTYADLRLARVAKTFSRCRAIANIRVTADRTEETRNAVKIIQIENQVSYQPPPPPPP
uniref:Calponin-homology (CH) domain-containing protein n=1 Tax=Mesocestoides corti TaxID=53468 RepID=A0A5K3FBY6_MESCO